MLYFIVYEKCLEIWIDNNAVFVAKCLSDYNEDDYIHFPWSLIYK